MPKRSHGGYYSPSFTAKKARKAGMSYRYKKSRKYKSKRNYSVGERGNQTSSLYNARRLPYRKYKNAVYKSLMFKESYRSYATAANTLTDTSTLSQKNWYTLRVPTNFYLTAGGFDGPETFANNKLIIKGGRLQLALRNDMAAPIVIETGLLRFKNDTGVGDFTGAVTTAISHDISNFQNFGTGYKLVSPMRKVIVQPGDTFTTQMKIPFQIINDLAQWTTESRNITFMVYTINTQASGAMDVARWLSHNLTFVADAIDTA